jgi:hypothetical protein
MELLRYAIILLLTTKMKELKVRINSIFTNLFLSLSLSLYYLLYHLANFFFNATLKYKRQSLSLMHRTNLDSLISGIQIKWPAFKIMEFKIYWRNPISNEDELIVKDSQLKQFHAQTVSFTVKSCCVGFSDYANKKAEALIATGANYNDHTLINTDDNAFPIENVIDHAITEQAKIVQVELHRLETSIKLEEASEYTKRLFISPLLVAAICYCNNVEKNSVSMLCEKIVCGKHGRGPIDFALLFKHIFVLLTVAKNTDMEGGQSQNIVQQESCRESLANAYVPFELIGENRKRKYDEVFSVVRRIPTFGIVTTANEWRFTMVDHSADVARLVKSSTYRLLLSPDTNANEQVITQLQNIEAILKRIVGILLYQMKLINENRDVQTLMDSVNSNAVNKREKSFVEMAMEMDADVAAEEGGNDEAEV